MRAMGAAVLLGIAACGGAPVSGSQPEQPRPQASALPGPVSSDSANGAMIPPGLGTLRQDQVAIVLQPGNVRITAIPLDESVIRTLSPDSYRALHSTVESRRLVIAQRASMHGVRDARAWYVTFTGLAPDARFTPTDITVTSGGRDYRPFDVIGLTNGFGEQRLQPRDSQKGLLLFDDGIDVSQPLVVSTGAERNNDWEAILKTIDSERASIRARAGGRP